MRTKTIIKNTIIVALLVIGINSVSSLFFTRIDLTQDQRYTLSTAAKKTIDQVNSPLIIDVFLEGNFPAEIQKLQNETRYLLEEIQEYNPNITFEFSNPVPEDADPQQIAQQFAQFGMTPVSLTVRDKGKESQELIFPWATINYNNQAVPVSLLKNIMGATPAQRATASVQNLEYGFVEGIHKIINAKSKRIAVLRGNGELKDGQIADLFRTLGDTYSIAPFPLDAATENPEKLLIALRNTFDLVVIAKPTIPFTDTQKYILDQYIVNGGNSLWLVDAVAMETDSLRANGQTLAFPRSLNLDDLFFKYGVRINPKLVQDLYAAPITLASGEGSNSQYVQYPWFYQPLALSLNNHPINTNLENRVRFEYANPMDLLTNNQSVEKTILLETSELSRSIGVPQIISFEGVTQEPNPAEFTAGSQTLAVLLEGTFTSAFTNRIAPVDLKEIRFRESGTSPAKMVVISDGDVMANALDKNGQPLELGFDQFTFQQYGNKEFLLNTVNYLLDDSGLINIRNREIALPFLDEVKTSEHLSQWQVLILGLPLMILGIFGFLFTVLRRRRYAR